MSSRNVTVMGKVTIIKLLVLPIIVQCLSVLPDPSPNIFKEIEQFNFTWNGKKTISKEM